MKKIIQKGTMMIVLLVLLCSTCVCSVQAAVANDAVYPIDSNSQAGWPQAPNVSCETAVLMDANTGEILYNKGMDQLRYPASITKVMTCLLALQNSTMDAQVTFTPTGLADQAEGTNIGMQAGEVLTMEQCLYVMMIQSANDVASQIAEYVGGTIPQFVDMMNAKAQELGCANTHFVNPNGLPNDAHYSTAHDFALIFREALKIPEFRTIIGTVSYQLPPTNLNPNVRNFTSHIAIAVPGTPQYQDYCLGGKSGLTIAAKNTLVTGAQKDDVTLVACVMRGAVEQVYADTQVLYEYGYGQFDKIAFDEGYALVPKGVTLEQLTPQPKEDGSGYIDYYYNGSFVGSGYTAPPVVEESVAEPEVKPETEIESKQNVVPETEGTEKEPVVKKKDYSNLPVWQAKLCEIRDVMLDHKLYIVIAVLVLINVVAIIMVIVKAAKRKKYKHKKVSHYE
ncbi:MAG: D-alanyl-D-alanine carboxypeptidase [Lachnospiraceae bacterium]|nr:D-alanyl-D-alanine carboxypeptidase [Lachnospiraceae bacterium]MDD3615813.1 D-alanyl-D-alanine carboxypeptidase [Lachnospiraceae bacterium]